MESEDDAPRTASEAKRPLATGESTSPSSSHRRSVSGPGLLSKLPFMKPNPSESKARNDSSQFEHDLPPPSLSSTTSPPAQQQQQQRQASRRRRGSLRKVALLGRGAQRERRDSKQVSVDAAHQASLDAVAAGQDAAALATQPGDGRYDALGLPTSEIAPQTQPDSFASESSLASSSTSSNSPTQTFEGEPADVPAAPSYNSTTDEEDVLHLPGSGNSPERPKMPSSSGSESYFGNRAALQPLRRTSVLRAKSPLSYSGLASTPMPAAEADVDYAETAWWGWVVLIVTWVVFVVGMGSCLGTWSWAWDVGTTPYAPPELEDDPTLPIVGYYPALIILTCIMAWVWVVVAWVGMKYFRHAKISGD